MQTDFRVVEQVHKIAFLRANAIGDFVYALPALEALRAAYPAAEIVYLGQAWHAGFLKDRPGPWDRVEVVPWNAALFPPPYEGGRMTLDEDPEEVEDFFRRMRSERFDLALQCHGGGGNSNPFIERLTARLNVGLRADGAPPLDRWIHYQLYHHEILRLLECVALVGAQPVTVQPRLTVTERDRAEAAAVVADGPEPLAVLHPFATDSRRHWDGANFAAVGDWLAGQGFQVLLIGSEQERAGIEAVLAHMQRPARCLAGQLSLNGLVGLLERASLFIGNDSGPIHLAEAVDTPSVGIYWAGNMIGYGPSAAHRHRQLLSWRMNCPVCGRDCMADNCEHQESFVDLVPVEEVIHAAQSVLANTQPVHTQQRSPRAVSPSK